MKRKKEKIALNGEKEEALHQVSIPVIENLKHGLYLQQEIGSGNYGEQTLELGLSGNSVIIQLGEWGSEEGRQFVVNLTDTTRSILEQSEVKG